eukprot:2326478-Rhodomonas_salina.1
MRSGWRTGNTRMSSGRHQRSTHPHTTERGRGTPGTRDNPLGATVFAHLCQGIVDGVRAQGSLHRGGWDRLSRAPASTLTVARDPLGVARGQPPRSRLPLAPRHARPPIR